LIAVSVVAAAVIAATLAVPASTTKPAAATHPETTTSSPAGQAAVLASFERLSTATSNRCGLQPAQIQTMPVAAMLQGSCCTQMNLARYDQQLAGLRPFAAIAEIPPDPYDISVALARQLLSYQTIPLDAAQEVAYHQAVALSHEHGPCCCGCWRWDAFAGQARYLITQHSFGAAQVANVWNLEDGCGGP
jgi:hypothetical protein